MTSPGSSGPASSSGRSASATKRPGSRGVGRCGREYCCSTWLTELSPVNLGLAKDQHLSLNPSQISGGLRAAALLPQVRARLLRHRPQALPQGRQDPGDVAGIGEGRGRRPLPRARLPPVGGGAADRAAPAAEGGDGGGRRRPTGPVECRDAGPGARAPRGAHRRRAATGSGRDAAGCAARRAGRRDTPPASPARAPSPGRRTVRRRSARQRGLSGALLPHDRHRLRQRGPAPWPRLREDRGRRDRPLSPASGRRRLVPDRDGRARPEGGADRRRAGAGPSGPGGPGGGAIPADVGAPGDFARPVHPDHGPRAQGRRAGADRADLRAAARRFLRAVLPRPLLRRLRGVQAGRRDRRRPLRAPPDTHAGVGRGAQLVLPALPVPRLPPRTHREAPRLHPARKPPERDPRPPPPGSRRHLRQPRPARVGRPLSAPDQPGRPADHVRLVRRPAQLLDGHPRGGVTGRVAGHPARHREGHHPLSLRHLARDADAPPASRCRSGSGRTASSTSAASGSARAPAPGSTSARRSTGSAPTPSAISSCAKFPGTPTAISPGSASRTSTPRTWPTDSATWPAAPSPCSRSTGTAWCPRRPTPRSTRPAGRRFGPTWTPWTPPTSAGRARPPGVW